MCMFLIQNGALLNMGLVGTLWDLCNRLFMNTGLQPHLNVLRTVWSNVIWYLSASKWYTRMISWHYQQYYQLADNIYLTHVAVSNTVSTVISDTANTGSWYWDMAVRGLSDIYQYQFNPILATDNHKRINGILTHWDDNRGYKYQDDAHIYYRTLREAIVKMTEIISLICLLWKLAS